MASSSKCGHTEVDDGDSGCVRRDGQFTDDGFDEVEYQLPIVASRRVVVADTSRVVEHERQVDNTRCELDNTKRRHHLCCPETAAYVKICHRDVVKEFWKSINTSTDP